MKNYVVNTDTCRFEVMATNHHVARDIVENLMGADFVGNGFFTVEKIRGMAKQYTSSYLDVGPCANLLMSHSTTAYATISSNEEKDHYFVMSDIPDDFPIILAQKHSVEELPYRVDVSANTRWVDTAGKFSIRFDHILFQLEEDAMMWRINQ